jgi:SulP family sulfate permease
LQNDLIAAVIVTIMLIPQSLAYALLAGLPPEAGLYASILPIILYAIFGTSRTLAVGPVAVVSLMTAAAVGQVADQGTAGYAVAALTLAVLSGGILSGHGSAETGLLANFLSHPVIAGFITASGYPDRLQPGQAYPGIEAHGHSLPEILYTLNAHMGDVNPITLALGLGATGFLFWVRKGLKPFLIARGVGPKPADVAQKAGPVGAVVVTTAAGLGPWVADRGVAIVGEVPQSLPPLHDARPFARPDLGALHPRAPDLGHRLRGVHLGRADPCGQETPAHRPQPGADRPGRGQYRRGFTGGYPVTGGFARSVVNFDAGAETPAAGAYTASGWPSPHLR